MISDLENLARQLYADSNGRNWADESWDVRDKWMSAARQRFDANGDRLPASGQRDGPDASPQGASAESAKHTRNPKTSRSKSVSTLPARQSIAERRAEVTDANARRILQHEDTERREKTERLKRARIAAELEATRGGLR